VQQARQEEKEGKEKEEILKGREGAPAAALIAAEWTSTGELRRRRVGGEE
jgi:hypothetical protein